MPNHFHFLIQVREEAEILKVMEEKESKLLNSNSNPFEGSKPSKEFSKFISQQFSHFFNGYTQAFNKQQNRKGSLFMTPYKRKLIDNEKYWRELIRYIHNNPVQSGIVYNLEDWNYSSYREILSDNATFVSRKEALEWFDNKDDFISWHRRDSDISDFF